VLKYAPSMPRFLAREVGGLIHEKALGVEAEVWAHQHSNDAKQGGMECQVAELVAMVD
jgi:hypothetical protein